MSADSQPTLMPSMLDRLVDASRSRESRLWYDESELVQSVERDLEDLLNARQTHIGLEPFPVLQATVLGFGLPDSGNFDLESPASRTRFTRTIEAVIRQFEPRVEDIHVTLLDRSDEQLRRLQFHINARLKVEHAPNVAFETTLQLTTGHYEVKTLGKS